MAFKPYNWKSIMTFFCRKLSQNFRTAGESMLMMDWPLPTVIWVINDSWSHHDIDTLALLALCEANQRPPMGSFLTLQGRHNGRYSVSNHQPHDCLLDRLFRRRSKKTSKLRVTGLFAGNSPGPVNSPHKWPVTRKMFPFDDVIMTS